MTVFLTDENKVIYGMYLWLREKASDVDIVTLRQICLYIASNNDKFNYSSDCILNSNDGKYELVINDGRRISFNNKGFGFQILREDNGLIMFLNIFENRIGDLSSVSVYGEIVSDNYGMYVVSFKNDDLTKIDMKFGNIEYYSNEDVKSDDINSFRILSRENMEMDCFDGYVSGFITRIDLLYDNFSYVVNKLNNKVRVREM